VIGSRSLEQLYAPLDPDDIPITGFVLDEVTGRVRAVVGDPSSDLLP
jgi:hypothetical protein